MTLAELQLDDLNWRDMVDAIRTRIAALSNEEWTLHAPVDPGVTLLELFAHELEQRMYWLDQVSDPLIHAMIALLGAAPRGAQAASTVLEVTSSTAVLPAGTVFELREQSASVRFSSHDELACLAVERIEIGGAFGGASLAASSSPRWAMQPLTFLGANGTSAEGVITLWLREPPSPEQRAKPLALLVELDSPARIPAGWAVDAVDDVPPGARLKWSYALPGLEARPFAPGEVEDGTLALRRSGLIRFVVPDAWQGAQAERGALIPLQLRVAAERSTFSAPPRLRRVVPNVVKAVHAEAVTVPWQQIERQVRDWLPLPRLSLALPERAPPIESSVRLRLLGRDHTWRDFLPTSDFARHGPEDAVFIVDRAANRLLFGDGLTGRLPVLAAPSVPAPEEPAGQALGTEHVKAELTYLAGGGEAGLLGSHLKWIGSASPQLEATNPVPARGGREPETAAAARDRVGASLYETYRAVTAADYETLAVDTPGIAVARAHAAVGRHPAFPCATVPGAVTVYLVPEVPRDRGWQTTDRAVQAPRADPGMLALVSRRLEERRLLTAEVSVRSAAYREVDVIATLAGLTDDRGSVGQRLREGLTAYLDALEGGETADGWPFGQPVRPSEITYRLQQLAGDDAQVAQVGVRLFEPATADAAFESCVDVRIAPHELIVLRSLALQWQDDAEPVGGLR